MISKNSKIIIIDDNYNEVKGLIAVLNREGIPFNYYTGIDEKDLPNKPINGVRILFLDFILGTEGQPLKTKISTILGVLQKTLSINNGPYIIVAWTKHGDMLDNLSENILIEKTIPTPLAIIDLNKSDCNGNIKKIEKKIKEKIEENEIIEILMNWESNTRIAYNDVLLALLELAHPKETEEDYNTFSKAWSKNIKKYICFIAKAYLGKNIQTNKNLLIGAQHSLITLLREYSERHIISNTVEHANLIKDIAKYKDGKIDDQDKAFLNSIFLLMKTKTNEVASPGSVYSYKQIKKAIKCANKECPSLLKITPTTILREFYSGNVSWKDYEHRNKIIDNSILIMLEVTPSCDHAQNNLSQTKFIIGALWPLKHDDINLGKKIKDKTSFIYVSPIINYKNEMYKLVFNARNLLVLHPKIFVNLHSIFKIRKEMLTDVQHWLSHQNSRPGKTEF